MTYVGIHTLTLKAPPINCSRRQFQILPPFQKLEIRHDIYKNRLLADDSHEIPYLIVFPKFGKMLQNLPSAAVVIGA